MPSTFMIIYSDISDTAIIAYYYPPDHGIGQVFQIFGQSDAPILIYSFSSYARTATWAAASASEAQLPVENAVK